MKCPHCGKETAPPKQTSPEGLLFHIKARIHQNLLLQKRRNKHPEEGYQGESESLKRSLLKWQAWADWVEEKIGNKSLDAPKKENNKCHLL